MYVSTSRSVVTAVAGIGSGGSWAARSLFPRVVARVGLKRGEHRRLRIMCIVPRTAALGGVAKTHTCVEREDPKLRGSSTPVHQAVQQKMKIPFASGHRDEGFVSLRLCNGRNVKTEHRWGPDQQRSPHMPHR
ncbi:hypothetical protein VOLCADRAFT_100445 [Volvox carteri f. nagariensis]|uniref:Uncharacterized protein n=1 Tax=Volvox carteri f. nagariensis TaxID=3068 RepID=D8UK82_VOLCA|nr:uncharacterized protein VOLCADRAFT_100445 [Volvox carteri f. nagariensis]EFJ39860.1 hypothetical protein VOLCADRAFT_100445 [Volvox carteri f. nagariensis]|eukprot:XP_002959066.1 hypothetical protein VOLCADRAFT_100445 [Volvox carteri f. nagariensis]